MKGNYVFFFYFYFYFFLFGWANQTLYGKCHIKSKIINVLKELDQLNRFVDEYKCNLCERSRAKQNLSTIYRCMYVICVSECKRRYSQVRTLASFILGTDTSMCVCVCVCTKTIIQHSIPYERMVSARKLNTADGYCDQFAKTDSVKLERSFKCSVRKSLCAHFIHIPVRKGSSISTDMPLNYIISTTSNKYMYVYIE